MRGCFQFPDVKLLGRTVLGVQILLLAACGGDDDDNEEAEAPRAAPTALQASVPKLASEPVTLRLASVQDQFAGVVERSIKLWNEGGCPARRKAPCWSVWEVQELRRPGTH